MKSGRRFASAKPFRVFLAMAIFATGFVAAEFLSLIGSGTWGSIAHLTALCRYLPPVSIRHRSSARLAAAGNDDGFSERPPIFLLADRIHRPQLRQ